MSKSVIAIVGRPNVGKSTLFNRLVGKRISIVDDTPGVTRDRVYYEITWNDRQLILVDTGGIEPRTDDEMLRYMRLQAELAIEHADVIIFMTDIKAGLTASDRDISTMLLKSGKPVVLCVNKVDRLGEPPPEFYEFYELGYPDDPVPVSSLHGSGTGDLLDAVVAHLPPESESDEDDGWDDAIRIAVIGKPNTGKSSLINRILGEDRLIVSDMAGTTRDAVDTFVENEHGKYIFVDTSGIRRQSRINDRLEYYSVLRAKLAAERADVCLIVIDATQDISEQDSKIAGLAHDSGRASIILLNKWDLVEKDDNTAREYTDSVYRELGFMTYAPVITVSALTGQRIPRLFPEINEAVEQARKRITTGVLNEVLGDAITRVEPPSDKGRRLKIYYMTQVATQPPTFVIYCNNMELFHFSYRRYIENQLREVFGFRGTPIKLIVRERGDGEK
ncbi:MAG: ribosome biogenesis GTPase Der [Eubacteriales bacterium]